MSREYYVCPASIRTGGLLFNDRHRLAARFFTLRRRTPFLHITDAELRLSDCLALSQYGIHCVGSVPPDDAHLLSFGGYQPRDQRS